MHLNSPTIKASVAFIASLAIWCAAVAYVIVIENQAISFDLLVPGLMEPRFLILLPCILGGGISTFLSVRLRY